MKNNYILNKYINFSLVFLPLTTPYWFPGTEVHMETMFLLLNLILLFFYRAGKTYVDKKYRLFFVYALFIPLFGYLLYGDLGTVKGSYITILLFSLTLFFYSPLIDISLVTKYYRSIVIVVSAFFIIQTILKAIGFPISGLMPFLNNKYGDPTIDLINKQLNESRCSSFFLEPSHFAQYILGYFALRFGDCLNQGKMYTNELIILSLILLITLSGNAYTMTSLIWGVAFLLSKKPIKTKVYVLTTLILMSIVVVGKMAQSDEGAKFINRSEELSSDQDRLSSGYVRIFRGFMVYSAMPIHEKVFGVGSGTISNVIDHSPYSWMFFGEEKYVNDSQVLLIGYGIVGTVIFALFLFSLFIRADYRTCFLVSLFVGLSFMELFWADSRMLIYLLIPYSIKMKLLKNRV